MPSVRGRLVAYLLLPLAFLMTISIWADHRAVEQPVNAAFDHALSRAALLIAAHVRRLPNGQLGMGWPNPPPPLRPRQGSDAASPSYPGSRAGSAPGTRPGVEPGPRHGFAAGPGFGP